MIILGLDINDHSTSACIVDNGAVAAAAQEERFNREKRTRRFPVSAMNWCMESRGLTIGDITAVAISANPAIYLEALNAAQSGRARFRGELLYSPVNYLLGGMGMLAGGRSRITVETDGGGQLDIFYIRHHDSHAASAFYQSPFEEAAVFTADAFGEKDSTVRAAGGPEGIRRIHSTQFPHSIGSFYTALTEFLGFRPDRDEWKLMGAAAHGDPAQFTSTLEKIITVDGDGGPFLDLSYFNHYQFHRPGMFTPRMEELLGAPYAPGAERDARFFDIAAAAQAVTENVVFEILRRLHSETGTPNLCLAGGVAMNCAMNGKIHENTPFENIYVPCAPDDSGTSVGAALATARILDPNTRTPHAASAALGPEYSDDEIEETLKLSKVKYEKCADPARAAAEMIASGKVVARFSGRMEFGERALGNRSILADPRDPRMKDRINSAVKFREDFRPFAPAVPAEAQADWFDCAAPVHFMEKAFRVKQEKRGDIPAVVHTDGTARLQTVSRDTDPEFHALVSSFGEITGVPMVLNTSFNVNEEPIVMSPRDALRTFFTCGIDCLVIGPFIVRK